jgi:uncharacterized protein YecA (UPF0149 family)
MPIDDETKQTLITAEDCENYAVNVEARGKPELASEARRLAIERRAAAHNATTQVERELLEAVYAYERALSIEKGKNTHASRTWQMIKRKGLIKAAETVVGRSTESMGYTTLAKMGLMDKAFEEVVVRHPDSFSAEAVSNAESRLRKWKADGNKQP